MPLIIDLNTSALTPVEMGVDFHWQTRDGGVGMNGVTQIASPLSGLWEISLVFEQNIETRVREYRSFKIQAIGRYTWIRVPICDPFRVKNAAAGWPAKTPVPWYDSDVPWSDPTPWAGSDVETITANATWPKNGTIIVLDVDVMGDALGVGHFISINDYLYLITRVYALQGSGGSTVRPYEILPPLREAVPPGSIVKVGKPTILCRLAEDTSGAIRLRLGRFGQPSMDFVEVLERMDPVR